MSRTLKGSECHREKQSRGRDKAGRLDNGPQSLEPPGSTAGEGVLSCSDPKGMRLCPTHKEVCWGHGCVNSNELKKSFPSPYC